MTLSDICIRRPVFATVLSLIVVLLGLMAYDRLSVREYPNIDVPIVTVNVSYPGASPEIMESQVAQPIEDVLSGIEGLDFVSSISRSENTQITAQFRLGSNSDEAANDVRDRLGRVRGLLPDEIAEPIVQKVEADAQPVIWLAFYSERYSAMEITDVLERVIKDRLQTIPGVSEVQIRRAHLRHAHLVRSGEARRAQPHRAGRGRRAAPAERRDSRRAYRIAAARIHRALGN